MLTTMANKTTSRRFLGLLRRAAKASRGGTSRTPADESAIWTLHEQALARTRDAAEGAQRIASNAAKQRGAADALADRAHAVAARAQELGTSFGRITDTFERLGLVALNAGLEGARLGETGGQAMLLVSDEVRAHAARGGDTARELGATLAEVTGELTKLHTHIDQAREASSDAAQEAARVATAVAETERALSEIGDRLKRATGSDPQVVRAVAEAGEHARALVAALGTLSGKVPRSLLVSALRPMLEPLARLLSEEEPGSNEEARG
jgi:methyl-accepting chemotaxis protein